MVYKMTSYKVQVKAICVLVYRQEPNQYRSRFPLKQEFENWPQYSCNLKNGRAIVPLLHVAGVKLL